jgi:hypothetical protein
MKNLVIIIFSFSLISASVFCQKNPPENVKREFVKKYTTAQSVKWDNEEKNEWEAEFRMEGKTMSASYDDSSRWIETETEITEKELPASVVSTLERDFRDFKKGHIEIFESPEVKGYEISLKKGSTFVEIVFDNNGKIIKKNNANSEDEKSENGRN